MSARTFNRFEKNASGDTFWVWLDIENRRWCAEQTSGMEKNYLSLPAVLRADTEAQLLDDLATHYSNEAA